MFRVQIFNFAILLLLTFSSFAQSKSDYVIKGRVTDAESGESLPFASVFLANTTTGTVTGEDGDFVLNIPNSGSYDLIIKFSGYKTYVQSVQFFEPNTITLDVKLNAETRFLGGVTVTAKKDEEWRRNLEDFKRGFLGTSLFAQQCKIMNEEAIDFYFDRENNVFEAFASEPLIIENRALGYRLKYVLEDYKVFFRERYTTYSGYPSFEELREGRTPRNKWVKNREIAYNGSLDHFFSSLFYGKLKEEGYIVQMAKDVDGKRFLDRNELDLNQFVKPGATENSKRLAFENILYVTYTKEAPGDQMGRSMGGGITISVKPVGQNEQVSQVFLFEGNEYIEFEQNGYVYNPLAFLVSEHWGYEKIGDLMPIDYRNSKQQGK